MYWKVPRIIPAEVSGAESCSVGSCPIWLRLELGRRRVQLGQAEVQELHTPLREEHVSRLQVAVDDPRGVRRLQGVCDLDPVAQDLVGGEGPALEAVGERFAVQQLHHEESVSPSRPTSWRVQMCGCCREEIARASRSNRERRSPSP
jgi:hypothetical protein